MDKKIGVSYRMFFLLVQGLFSCLSVIGFAPSVVILAWLSRAQGNQGQVPGAAGSQVSAMAEAYSSLVAGARRMGKNIYFTRTIKLSQILWRMD